MSPVIPERSYVADSAEIFGDVSLGERSSVWPKAVLRGDIIGITVGEDSNVQDGTVIHVGNQHPVHIGNRVTIGHGCMIHGCSIGDDCLIGMGAILLNGAVIGDGSLVAAGSVVTEGMAVPSGVLVAGVPAKVKRLLNPDDKERMEKNWQEYITLAERHKSGEFKINSSC